ncbi:WD40/YVTN/BNR-like repeat-containing protein [Stutzerimonas kunmingensis]|uniref:WD40/YVTN/BNR-like repeat-containing protein n=1 Tax=Stutzerimonas kunmingensis TaxID=1211807 RepID=UPI0035ADF179
MAVPTVTPLPIPPNRTSGAGEFAPRADIFFGAMPQFQTDMNTLATYSGQQVSLADTARIAAEQAKAAAESARSTVVTRANEVATNTNTVVTRANEVATNTQQVAANTQQVATDAQAVADALASIADGPVTSVNGKTGVVTLTSEDVLPPFAGNSRRALVVNADETGAEWGDAGQKVGDVLITARTPDASYLPATGNIYMQSAYPELFEEVGLIGGDVALAWEHVANGLTSFAINDVAMGDDGVCIAVSNGAVYRSIDNGLTWTIYTHASLTGGGLKVQTDGNGVWVILNNTTARRSLDNGITWQSSTLQSGSATILSFKTDQVGTWVAALSTGRPRVSTNNGQTWAELGGGQTTVAATAIETDGNGYWIFGTGDGQVYQANAGNWIYTTLATGFPSQVISGIATDRNGVWIIIGSNYVTRSLNDRVTWETVTGASLAGNGKLVTNGRGVWLSASTNSSIRRSLDNGLSWENGSVPGAPSAAFNGAACAGDYFVAVGSVGLFAASKPVYGYDTTTQFRLPKLPAPAGLSAYIKGSNV